jgi:hypothetical protein
LPEVCEEEQMMTERGNNHSFSDMTDLNEILSNERINELLHDIVSDKPISYNDIRRMINSLLYYLKCNTELNKTITKKRKELEKYEEFIQSCNSMGKLFGVKPKKITVEWI